MTPIVKIILTVLIVVCVLLSGFFSASEIVYSGVSKIKLKKKVEEGSKKAKAASKISDNFTDALSTILVGNNLVNILTSVVSTRLAIEIWNEEIGPTMAVILSTIIVLIFGEIVPKAVGNRYNYNLSMMFASLFNFFRIIFFPITFVVTKFVSLLAMMWTPKEKEPTATDEELIVLAEEMEEEGVIDEDDAELIISAIDFCDVTAHEIMVPRVDVFAIDIDDDQKEILSNEEIFRYSRVPVYEDTIDNVIGILNTVELMKKILKGEKINLRSLLSEPIYVHKTKPISTILTEFKKGGQHLAIVLDEFGGFMGIVTMEDIVEELVGDIFDEMDEVVEDYTVVGENEYIVDGDMNIYDFFDLVEYDDRDFDSEYTTIGGWCTDILGHFPQVGDTFNYANFDVTIIEIDKMRVEKVKVVVHKEIDEDKESED